MLWCQIASCALRLLEVEDLHTAADSPPPACGGSQRGVK